MNLIIDTNIIVSALQKDRIFYDIAKCCKARLVTGNNKHYPVDELVTSLWELERE